MDEPDQPQVSLRIVLGSGARIGPGKIELLEQVRATGSISAAGRALGMSYRRAWALVSDLNATLRSPVVRTSAGGPHGGGTIVTQLGDELIESYRSLQRAATELAAERFKAF